MCWLAVFDAEGDEAGVLIEGPERRAGKAGHVKDERGEGERESKKWEEPAEIWRLEEGSYPTSHHEKGPRCQEAGTHCECSPAQNRFSDHLVIAAAFGGRRLPEDPRSESQIRKKACKVEEGHAEQENAIMRGAEEAREKEMREET